ncbi:tRNA pseudouridine(55) synthase TruB [Ferribacterium limneticum]|uniref:tRNA pseudouridine(55) synthase TruB n=1 Tax=Ferribacterium limneticum TaxID=76259 RepID=UPI001CFB70FE|nr:tRNA pseudouridine(55) synthase TruB [Ferribacterium limneticum]UCV30438.1 tRNA pseudouridine(55) synthase TruB [Ferribacterium limneticum]UCV34354.1 tRNA pseudouridine(55) synthase TruB [Ferribacterium limneticum]
MQFKRTWKQVDGVLLLDKPLGMTSNDALQKARRLFSAAKGGHTGTLDPLATGLLPLCFGEATKFSADLLGADKTYEAVLKLGVTTDSGDAEGQVTATAVVDVRKEQLSEVLAQFVGDIQQIPPMHSALKRNGRPLYELARKGIEVEREPRTVTIYAIDSLDFAGDSLTIRVACSKGTYIRVLAADIGNALGCGAHLAGLRRTVVGDIQLGNSITLAELESLDEAARMERLLPVDALLQSLPVVLVEGAEAERFSHGNPVSLPAGLTGKIRVYAEGRLIGVGEPGHGDLLWPKRLVQLAD